MSKAPWTQIRWVGKETRRINGKAAKPKPKERKHKKRTRIPPVSKRQQRTNTRYRAKAAAYKTWIRRMGYTCPVVAAVPELRHGRKYGHPISAKIVEIHHRRGRLGALLMDERTWLAVSKQGHRWIHENPERAMELGFLERNRWNVQLPVDEDLDIKCASGYVP